MAEKVITVADSITVNELADQLNLPVAKLIGELFKDGVMATMNQRLDFDTASIIIDELGYEDVEIRKKVATHLVEHVVHQASANAPHRPPIVAVMGHVDHGKTTLLDSILGTDVVSDESGGITQKISAYQTTRNGRLMTLLDTPGHEAFAALRQHSAQLTDVVIIVVAADDGVKPQTVEAIKFARSANATIVVAVNKIDKPEADPNRVRTQLATDYGLNPEEWGGDTVFVDISAKTGQNVDKLLDMVLLVADMADLRADIDVSAEGLIIEARTEVGRGSVVGLLVEQGTLKVGQYAVAGIAHGKIRTMQNYKGQLIRKASPATPVVVTGFKQLPDFGDTFKVVKTEKEARNLANATRLERERNAASSNVTSSDLLKLMNQEREVKDFKIIVKADVQGSLTSVIDSLNMIDTKGEVALRVVSNGVGNISENDINSAASDSDSRAIIYGFGVSLPSVVKRMAMSKNVEVRLFNIIYELIDDVKREMTGLLAPEIKETEIGRLKIKGIFRTTKAEVIAGGEVTKGKIAPNLLVRIERAKTVIGEAEIEKVQRGQQKADEVFAGEMCGVSLKTAHRIDLAEDDMLYVFKREMIDRKL